MAKNYYGNNGNGKSKSSAREYSNNSKRKSGKGNRNKGNSGFSKNPPYSKQQYGKGDKQMRRLEDVMDTGAAMSRSNPISFYNKYLNFAKDASNFQFAWPLGTPVDVTISGTSGTYISKYSNPGIMRIAFAPTVGVSSNMDSPMNRSSINYYGRIRSRQKYFGDWDHQDLTMMLLCIDSACMFHALGRRIYGLMKDMTPINTYYPVSVIAAHNVQFSATQKELQDFRSWLNEFALRIEQYALPDNIELIKRHQWMCEGIYVDSPSEKAQTYLFVPTGFWKYNNTVSTGSQLDWVPYLSQTFNVDKPMTISEFEAIGESLMNAMSNEADFAEISGALYAYYENSSLMKLPYVTEDYSILPSYDRTVLSQIENATIMGPWGSGYSPVISQNPNVNEGAIIFEPKMYIERTDRPETMFMNMHMDHPSPDEIMEATRLMAKLAVIPAVLDTNAYPVEFCASEMVQWVDIFVRTATMNLKYLRIQDQVHYFDTETESVEANTIGQILYLAKFDWAPALRFWHTPGTGQPSTSAREYLGSTWDTDNYSPIPANYLKIIHTAALYSLFNIES